MKKYYFIALAVMCFVMAFLPVSLNAAGPPQLDVNVVKNMENPARSAYIATEFIDIPEGATGNNLSFYVPTGQRLVIEYVSIRCFTITDDQFVGASLLLNKKLPEAGYTSAIFTLPFRFSGVTANGDAIWEVSQQVRLYTEGESIASLVSFVRNNTVNSAQCTPSVSGYTVGVP